MISNYQNNFTLRKLLENISYRLDRLEKIINQNIHEGNISGDEINADRINCNTLQAQYMYSDSIVSNEFYGDYMNLNDIYTNYIGSNSAYINNLSVGNLSLDWLNMNNITCNYINGYQLPISWGGVENTDFYVPRICSIKDDSVLEIGAFLDFHGETDYHGDATLRMRVENSENPSEHKLVFQFNDQTWDPADFIFCADGTLKCRGKVIQEYEKNNGNGEQID